MKGEKNVCHSFDGFRKEARLPVSTQLKEHHKQKGQ